jgi:hypothetical protein
VAGIWLRKSAGEMAGTGESSRRSVFLVELLAVGLAGIDRGGNDAGGGLDRGLNR